MTTITRDTVKSLSLELKTVLDAFAKEHGLAVQINGGRFDENTFTPRVTFSAIRDGEVITRESVAFKRSAHLYGLNPDDLGAQFNYKGRVYEITGLLPRGSKFTISVKRVPDGAPFKFPDETVIRLLKTDRVAVAKPAKTKPEAVAVEYSRGDQVKVKWTDNRWYDATYLKPSVKKPGCHLVKFEDGSNFAAELIKRAS